MPKIKSGLTRHKGKYRKKHEQQEEALLHNAVRESPTHKSFSTTESEEEGNTKQENTMFWSWKQCKARVKSSQHGNEGIEVKL